MAAKAATLARREKKTRPRWVRRVKRVCAVLFLFFLIGFTVFGVMFVNEMRHASELLVTLPEKLRQYSTEPSKIISADGQVLYTVQMEFRDPVTYEQIPKVVRDAVVAAEDKRYWDHSGVDYIAMARILVVGAKEGRLSQGGSTLTMQLAKRFYSEGEKTFNRKLQDVALAVTMERDMTKEQILTLYLNTMYFGEKAYGIQAASEVYFGKTIDKLTTAEAAMLARCVRRPSDENPVRNMEKAIENRNVVLGIMRDEGKISKAVYDEAIAEAVKLTTRKERVTSHTNKAAYFVSHVQQFLEDDMPDIDIKAGGYTIYTTIDTKLQDFAEKEVIDFVREHRGDKVNSACFVLIDKDGRILAEVGGMNYQKNQFNIVTQGMLQPGSSFKAVLYATAFSLGTLSMDDYLPSMPFDYDMGPGAKPWSPKNSSRRENMSSVSVRTAFASSFNIPAAHIMERTGPEQVKNMAATAFGMRSIGRRKDAPPSMALGSMEVHPLEMAQAYSVFMLHGDRATPFCVTKVVGPDGNIARTYGPNIIRNQLDPGVCSQMDELLRAVVTDRGATGVRYASAVPEARGKTGTTSDNKDAWFCGYADGLVGISWCGNMVVRNGRVYQLEMGSHMFGGTAAAKFWATIMNKARKKFASKVAEPIAEPPIDPTPEDGLTNPEDRVRIIPPDDTPPDGTTGGDGGPVIDPDHPPLTTTTGGGTEPPPTTTDPPPVKHDPPKTDPPKNDPPPPREDREVSVEVCAESGQRATIYCPETVTRSYKRGREPRGRCKIHGS